MCKQLSITCKVIDKRQLDKQEANVLTGERHDRQSQVWWSLPPPPESNFLQTNFKSFAKEQREFFIVMFVIVLLFSLHCTINQDTIHLCLAIIGKRDSRHYSLSITSSQKLAQDVRIVLSKVLSTQLVEGKGSWSVKFSPSIFCMNWC